MWGSSGLLHWRCHSLPRGSWPRGCTSGNWHSSSHSRVTYTDENTTYKPTWLGLTLSVFFFLLNGIRFFLNQLGQLKQGYKNCPWLLAAYCR